MIIEEKVQEILLAKSFTETSGKGRTNEKVLITDKDFSAFSKKIEDATWTDEKNINTWKRVFGHLKTPNDKVVFSKNTLMEYGDIITINMLKTNYPLMVTDIIRNGISKGTYTSANGHNIQSVEILSRKEKYDF